MSDAFSRTSDHDPSDLNELAGLIIDGFEGFVNLTDRYGTAVLILESDWLARQRSSAPVTLNAIRQIVREEIEASKPKITLHPPRTREQFLAEWEFERKLRKRKWFR